MSANKPYPNIQKGRPPDACSAGTALYFLLYRAEPEKFTPPFKDATAPAFLRFRRGVKQITARVFRRLSRLSQGHAAPQPLTLFKIALTSSFFSTLPKETTLPSTTRAGVLITP